MVVVVVVIFVTIVVVMVFVTNGREATFAGTKIFAETARFNVRAGCRCALTLDMVMVTLLRQPDFGLESQDRGPILARPRNSAAEPLRPVRLPVRRTSPGPLDGHSDTRP